MKSNAANGVLIDAPKHKSEAVKSAKEVVGAARKCVVAQVGNDTGVIMSRQSGRKSYDSGAPKE